MQIANHKLKIIFYSPYLHILGGGERYILSFVSYLSSKYEVTLFASKECIQKAKTILNIPLENIILLPPNEFTHKNFLQRYLFLKKYDILFYMTDGSVPLGGARNNYIIVQSPAHMPTISLFNRFKLHRWKIICYSQYMQNIISKNLGEKAMILNPSIDIAKFSCDVNRKKNYILTVGRFFQGLHDKKQEEMIDIFIRNYRKNFNGWEFILIGGATEESSKKLIKQLRNKIKGYPVKILINIPFSQLVEYYKLSKIYWHAAGFGEDLEKHPEKAEHFGITTIEAMSAGCVPIVFGAGGQKDIIRDKHNGYFWLKEKELILHTRRLIQNQTAWTNASRFAKKDAIQFAPNNFYEKLEKIIH
jgi:glycosyltransferase involved in cell wall biosynthesis